MFEIHFQSGRVDFIVRSVTPMVPGFTLESLATGDISTLAHGLNRRKWNFLRSRRGRGRRRCRRSGRLDDGLIGAVRQLSNTDAALSLAAGRVGRVVGRRV